MWLGSLSNLRMKSGAVVVEYTNFLIMIESERMHITRQVCCVPTHGHFLCLRIYDVIEMVWLYRGLSLVLKI